MTATPHTKSESERLRELVREIGLPLRRLQEVMEMKPEDCLAWWSNQKPQLKIDYVPFGRLSAMVAINENQLFTGAYNRELARERVLGNYLSLPDRYQENQNSYLRTSAHIIRYVVLTRGQHFADQLLFDLNVSPLIYKHDDARINLTYFADLLEALAHRGFTQEELDTLASVIFLSLQETALGRAFKKSEDPFDVYQTLAKNFDYFDSNFEYENQFVGKKYILSTTLPLEHHALLKQNPESVKRLMRYRHILLAWFPYLAGMTPIFPKMEVIRSNEILKVQYEFDLTKNPKQPKKLLVV